MSGCLKDITGTDGRELAGRRIALCITGSVAAIQCPDLARALMRRGADVTAVMSGSAAQLLSPDAMQWATGNPVVTRLTGRTEHIELAGDWPGKVDVILVAPATANTLAKMAAGIDDTPVLSVISSGIGAGIPVILAPGMHATMLHNPFVAGAARALEAAGIEFVAPVEEEAKAKMAPVPAIVEAVIRRLSAPSLRGVRVLITAGPTVEHLDPVRVLTNRSTGKMGVALARQAARQGAAVTLVYGPGSEPPPENVRVIRVETAAEMEAAVLEALRGAHHHLFIGAAAVADYTPVAPSSRKIPTAGGKKVTVVLQPSPKIIAKVKKAGRGTVVVGFKAEHGCTDAALVSAARKWLGTNDADLVVANDVGRPGVGFGADTNEVMIVPRKGPALLVRRAPKGEVAAAILSAAAALLTPAG